MGESYAEVCFLFVRQRSVISLWSSALGWIGSVLPSAFAISNSIIPTILLLVGVYCLFHCWSASVCLAHKPVK